MQTTARVLPFFALLTLTAPVAAARQEPLGPAPTFELVADTTTAVPNGTGTFSLFADARAFENGRVAFIGYDSGSGSGIYVVRNGSLEMLVDTQTTVPGTGNTFTTFFDVALDGSLVAFTGGWPGPGGGCSFSGTEGVFGVRFGGGGLTAVATSLSTANNCFHGVDFEQRVIAVAGGVDPVDVFHNHSEAVFASKRPGQLIPVYDTATPKPGGGTFVGYDQDFRIRQGGVLFSEILVNTLGAVAGLYVDLRDGQGPRLVADQNTLIPGGGGDTFMNFAGSDWDGQTVAFMGRDSSNRSALYTATAGGIQIAVDRNTAVPGDGTNFLGFANFLAYDGGFLVFSGFWTGGGYGLFTEESGIVRPILKKGDLLGGNTVDQAFCRQGNKSGGQLLVEVRFANTERGLYLVTL